MHAGFEACHTLMCNCRTNLVSADLSVSLVNQYLVGNMYKVITSSVGRYCVEEPRGMNRVQELIKDLCGAHELCILWISCVSDVDEFEMSVLNRSTALFSQFHPSDLPIEISGLRNAGLINGRDTDSASTKAYIVNTV